MNCPARLKLESSRVSPTPVPNFNPRNSSSVALDFPHSPVVLKALVSKLVKAHLLSNPRLSDALRACASKLSRPIIIDSGCNHTICSNEAHSDSPVIRSSIRQKVEVATGALADISGTAVVHGLDSLFVPSFEDSLLSVSQYTECSNILVLCFFKDSMIGVTLTPDVKILIDNACNFARKHNLITLNGVANNGL